jgi:MFS family permease
LLTSILELGAWLGTLFNGYLADALGRRLTVLVAVVVFCVGVIVQACTQNKDFVFAGRFVTGLGVGSLSMIVPLYNAELAPPEIRGSLVAVQQLAITFGIMVSFWVRSSLCVACVILTGVDRIRHELYRWHWGGTV